MGIQRFLTLLFLFLVIAAPVTAQQDPAMAQHDLAQLRERIGRLEKQLSRRVDTRNDAVRELRDAERAEGNARRELNKLQVQLNTAQARKDSLDQQIAQGRKTLAVQLAQLEKQLRAAYTTGRQEWLRVVLSEEDPVELGRRLVYYAYLSRSRSAVMEQIRKQLAELAALAQQSRAEQTRLEELAKAQQTRLDELAAHRQARQAALKKLDRGIAGDQARIAALTREAEELSGLVAELTQALADLPLNDAAPFSGRKGKMHWPVAGRRLHHFGQKRADGRLRWEGELLAASPGSEVHAIHHGRVVFADWLQGLGLLIVLDHGDGYMSLYGHNQDLVRDVGDWVSTGDVLAHAGDSGGQSDGGLYFEIRRNGRPINPRPWMRSATR